MEARGKAASYRGKAAAYRGSKDQRIRGSEDQRIRGKPPILQEKPITLYVVGLVDLLRLKPKELTSFMILRALAMARIALSCSALVMGGLGVSIEYLLILTYFGFQLHCHPVDAPVDGCLQVDRRRGLAERSDGNNRRAHSRTWLTLMVSAWHLRA